MKRLSVRKSATETPPRGEVLLGRLFNAAKNLFRKRFRKLFNPMNFAFLSESPSVRESAVCADADRKYFAGLAEPIERDFSIRIGRNFWQAADALRRAGVENVGMVTRMPGER